MLRRPLSSRRRAASARWSLPYQPRSGRPCRTTGRSSTQSGLSCRVSELATEVFIVVALLAFPPLWISPWTRSGAVGEPDCTTVIVIRSPTPSARPIHDQRCLPGAVASPPSRDVQWHRNIDPSVLSQLVTRGGTHFACGATCLLLTNPSVRRPPIRPTCHTALSHEHTLTVAVRVYLSG